MNRFNMTIILQMIIVYVIINKTYSYENKQEERPSDIFMNNPSINSAALLDESMKKRFSFKAPLSAYNRPSESAEKYFQWVEKTDRPVEFFRGKRFWLFAKKDDSGASAELAPSMNSPQNSLTHGLWRSGIVGRRRRR